MDKLMQIEKDKYKAVKTLSLNKELVISLKIDRGGYNWTTYTIHVQVVTFSASKGLQLTQIFNRQTSDKTTIENILEVVGYTLD